MRWVGDALRIGSRRKGDVNSRGYATELGQMYAREEARPPSGVGGSAIESAWAPGGKLGWVAVTDLVQGQAGVGRQGRLGVR